MADEFKKIAATLAAGKAVHDLDEIKKQTTIQANEAKKQTLLHEKQLEEQRLREQEREEREIEEKLKLENDKNSSKYQEFIDKSEALNLNPFAAMILYRFFELKNLMSFNRAVERLKKIAESEHLDFIKLDNDPNMKRSQLFIDGLASELSLEKKVITEKTIELLIECIRDDELNFGALLEDYKKKTLIEIKENNEKLRKKELQERENVRKILIERSKRDTLKKGNAQKLKKEIDRINESLSLASPMNGFFRFVFSALVLVVIVSLACFASLLTYYLVDGFWRMAKLDFMSFGAPGFSWGGVIYLVNIFKRIARSPESLKKTKVDLEKKLDIEIKKNLGPLSQQKEMEKAVNDFYSRKLLNKLTDEEECEVVGLDPSVVGEINSTNRLMLHQMLEKLTDEFENGKDVCRKLQLAKMMEIVLKKIHQKAESN